MKFNNSPSNASISSSGLNSGGGGSIWGSQLLSESRWKLFISSSEISTSMSETCMCENVHRHSIPRWSISPAIGVLWCWAIIKITQKAMDFAVNNKYVDATQLVRAYQHIVITSVHRSPTFSSLNFGVYFCCFAQSIFFIVHATRQYQAGGLSSWSDHSPLLSWVENRQKQAVEFVQTLVNFFNKFLFKSLCLLRTPGVEPKTFLF